ncbi:berberine protein [Purpureocillium lavendulum]|uniref:Berberine protein n=1 Tax=Purpureocillium lavendulum TaxID=1247861 RepID=A0AB34FYV9_9HYPO|nr:berberine protein [Purpureocillium lavendulum]
MMMKLSHLVPLLAWAFAHAAAQGTPATYDCSPGKACWPTSAQWNALNATLGGRLHQTVPLAAPCFPSHPAYNVDKCNKVASNYTYGIGRASVYGAAESIQYEACGSSADCQLLSISPSMPPLFSKCSLGRLAAYYVDAVTAAHVSATLAFVKQHNIRLSIKNTGHDYLGRSMAPNSLALWTHNMKTLAYHKSFTANNCPAVQLSNVGEMGAGVMAFEAYGFFERYGMNACGGNAASVGLAGGYGQGGGHGIFAPMYGLMVDQAVEFDVVTADGQFRTVNQCSDPDLFWAMRGGGGGTYAVLVAYRFRLYPAVPIHMHVLKANYSILGEKFTQSAIVRSLLTAHVANQSLWSDNNVTGRYYYGANQATLLTILPFNDDGSRLKDLTAKWRKGVTAIPNLKVYEDSYYTYPTYSAYDKVAQEIAARLTPNGFASNVASRLVPRSLFSSDGGQQKSLVDAALEGMERAFSALTIVKPLTSLEVLMTTPANVPDAKGETSANPAWRDSLWHAIFLGGWMKGYSIDMQQDVIEKVNDAAQPLRHLTPGGGSYANEDSILVEDWQRTFYGSNYARLLAIKDRYDPTHLFDCYKCVGWRGSQE